MSQQKNDVGKSEKDKDDGILEEIARKINPPSREVSDEELIDPGSHAAQPTPKDNKPKPADTK